MKNNRKLNFFIDDVSAICAKGDCMNITKLNILLTCNLGASTSIMVNKMEDVRKASLKLQAMEMKIEAHPVMMLEEVIHDFDVVLLGPQMRHRLQEVELICKPLCIPVQVIDAKDYGTMNAGNIIKSALVLKLNNI